ncbi:hypothetical protein LJR245_002017 [Rhizobium leguminosarum]|uniref:hypothetical protein n=1 Tax=Rhizobium leguminosarum TaxID=384 RepID=UPI003ED125EE
MADPAVPQGGFHGLSERRSLMVQDAARRHLAGHRVRLEPHDPVFQNLAGGQSAEADGAAE